MPPKRKAPAAKPAKSPKKAKTSVESGEPPSKIEVAKSTLAKVPSGSRKTHKIDTYCSVARNSNAAVYKDYDCMLNQTNIGDNNNKFYVIQLIQVGSAYYTWNRWGRVGEPGANAFKVQSSLESAIKEFEKKFKDKTRNEWKDRNKFKAFPKSYTLLEMGEEDEEADSKTVQILTSLSGDGSGTKFAPSKLDAPTQNLIQLIFSTDMFNNALEQMKIDTKKMPLGKLSKTQIMKGFDILEELEREIDAGRSSRYAELSSTFYTHIPHSFGRVRPPVMSTHEHVRQKMDMLLVLADIELAQQMQKDKTSSASGTASTSEKLAPHPADVNYDLLKCELSSLDPKSAEYKVIEKYTNATQGYRSVKKILNVWKVDRETDGDRFAAHETIANRKLLWHGTNVAVVAAILKTGLRIMPHSGGRVGKGIYFASENSKSSGYVGTDARNVGIMFLCEVALGKEHSIKVDNCSLKHPPPGFDSIVARGHTEPDSSLDVEIKLDGKKVIVPQGKPIRMKEWSDSNFSQSEYLIYKESQHRIRFMLEIQF